MSVEQPCGWIRVDSDADRFTKSGGNGGTLYSGQQENCSRQKSGHKASLVTP